MNKFLFLLFLLSGTLLIYVSCKKDVVEPPEPITDPQPSTGVSVDLASVPYTHLSSYKFFEGELKNQIPADGVIEYAPASSLFTDYALKKRFIWMPQGTSASYVNDGDILDLPVGAALIKNFYYEHVLPGDATRIIETRVMIRKSGGWIFAEYVWNEEQTEATLHMTGDYVNLSWVQDGETKSTDYRIPSETECLICHKQNEQPIPIGIKPQNLNHSFAYSDGTENQLQKLIAVGYLQNNLPGNIYSTVDYHDETQDLELRLRSYLDINCAHCHSEGRHCDYRPMRLAYGETTTKINMGLCVEPDEFINSTLTYIITPSNISRSVMHFRLNSTEENMRMPLLGRTLVHEEGVQLLEDWINSIEFCE